MFGPLPSHWSLPCTAVPYKICRLVIHESILGNFALSGAWPWSSHVSFLLTPFRFRTSQNFIGACMLVLSAAVGSWSLDLAWELQVESCILRGSWNSPSWRHAQVFILTWGLLSSPEHCRIWKTACDEGMFRPLTLPGVWSLALPWQLPLSSHLRFKISQIVTDEYMPRPFLWLWFGPLPSHCSIFKSCTLHRVWCP